jgi:formamidopyrimidine-DNA glycosylase
MPELPEVETVRRGLEEILSHHPVIERIELRRPDLRWEIPVKKVKSVEGQAVLAVGRRAKYLWFKTAKGFLISHLGMTGSWRVQESEKPHQKSHRAVDPHDHIVLHFSDQLSLVFRDPRRFGIFNFSKDLKESPFTEMGPEPLLPEFSAEYLKARLKGKKAPIKNALMDQRIVVGIGNIYASEILFESGVRPSRAAERLTLKQLEQIVETSRTVLDRAIRAGGSTLRDFAHTNGESGAFQNEFKVYGRAGEECLICGQAVKSAVLAGRSTFWCSSCQH